MGNGIWKSLIQIISTSILVGCRDVNIWLCQQGDKEDVGPQGLEGIQQEGARMIIKVDKTGSVEGFQSMLNEVTKDEKVKGLLVLACDENGFTPNSVDSILQEIALPLFGGIFPQIIHGTEKLLKGTIVAGLSKEINVNLVPHLSDMTVDYDDVIDDLIPQIGDAKTMFVLVDGYSQRISSLIDSLFNIFGLELNYIGGGAGSINPSKLNMTQTPCLFTNKGLAKDSAILTMMDIQSGIGVSHGWNNKLSGPYKVTESDGNAIKSLDWKPAFEVYKDVVEKHSGKTFTEDNFFEIAKGYPLGIVKLESEKIIRDPFTVDENNCLIVAAEVIQESFVDILTGDLDSLVGAASKAYSDSIEAFAGGEERSIMFMDCISRVLFLGDNFSKEIDAVRIDGTPLIGALSLGEIANSGRDYLEWYNKTCVVGILGD